MTKFNANSQYLLDTEINQMLKDIYSDAKDSYNTVTQLLTEKVRSIDWLKVKEDTIKYSSQTYGFIHSQVKKIDWMDVFEIFVAGLLVFCRGLYLAGFYTGKAIYWGSEKISELTKTDWKSVWYEVKEESLTKLQLSKDYLTDLVGRLVQEYQSSLTDTASASTPAPAPTSTSTPTHTTVTTHTPSPATATATTQPQGLGDQNGGAQVCGTGMEVDGAMAKGLSAEIASEELDILSMEQDNAEVIAETAYHQYQAMTESAEELESLCDDLENIEDSICRTNGIDRAIASGIYNSMTVQQLREIAGTRSKRYAKEALIKMVLDQNNPTN